MTDKQAKDLIFKLDGIRRELHELNKILNRSLGGSSIEDILTNLIRDSHSCNNCGRDKFEARTDYIDRISGIQFPDRHLDGVARS